jgi:hypothetical protein
MVLSLPTLKIDFVQISVYESHALLPGLRNCLLSPPVPTKLLCFRKTWGGRVSLLLFFLLYYDILRFLLLLFKKTDLITKQEKRRNRNYKNQNEDSFRRNNGPQTAQEVKSKSRIIIPRQCKLLIFSIKNL